MLSQALPEQEIESGQVRIKVSEGFVGELEVLDDIDSHTQKHIEAYFSGLTDGHVATLSELETSLMLANELPGIATKLMVGPMRLKMQ